MTCIVALKYKKEIFIGGDSCGSNGHNFAAYPRKKVFVKSDFIYGCTTSYRMIDILEYVFTAPARKIGYNPAAYMREDFIPALRTCFKDNGFSEINNSVEKGGVFLVGFDGALFEIQADFSVLETPDYGAAIGSGGEAAKAVLYHLKDSPSDAKFKINSALYAAEGTIVSVRQPFFIEKL
jgi:ATP-dependent protease HslVU (ClpYQ) peptidase subunit